MQTGIIHSMLELTNISAPYFEQLCSLSVNEEQKKFVGTISGVLESINELVHLHLIIANKSVIGVFLLDLGYSKKHAFAPSTSLGLRAYMIDSRYQGKGYGTQAIKLLPAYLKQNYAKHKHIFLTVNCKNPVARRCYINGGFLDTEQLYLGGAAGPQHIMKLEFA